MISLLTGNILKKFDKFVILNVNDVGYKIYVSDKTINKIDFNEKVSLLCDLQIKDDSINLTGFFDQEEQDAFRLLNSIQGVGTKAALSILSSLTPNELVNAIISDDKKTITQSEGIGNRIASRIINELKSKVENLFVKKDLTRVSLESNKTLEFSKKDDKSIIDDAVSALVNLGYSKTESYITVREIVYNDENKNLSEIITSSLKKLN